MSMVPGKRDLNAATASQSAVSTTCTKKTLKMASAN